MDKKPEGALKMRNIPTDIYIENGAVKNHGGEIAALGKKAMIVTGRMVLLMMSRQCLKVRALDM